MKVTLDRSANAAYISLTSSSQDEPYHMYPCDPIEVGGQINLDFDTLGRLVGIEIMDAKRLLPEDLLNNAEIIG